MGITLNTASVEIDGKVYKFYKINLGFQRKLIELQSNLAKLNNELAKKYSIEVSEITESDKVSEEDKLEIAKKSLDMQDAVAGLFVNPDEAGILDNFDANNITELINSLQ